MARLPTVLAAAGLLAAAGGVLTAPRRWAAAADPTGGRPLELPEGSERVVTSADGTPVACWEMGDAAGPLVVLGHGWTADRRVWAATARRLVADGLHVVAFDQRGHGRSGVGADGLTIVGMAADLRAVLEAFDARGAIVAGHSMGGMAAQTYAVLHPDELRRSVGHLVLISTAARRPTYGGPGSPAERLAVALSAAPPVQAAMASDRIGPYLVRGSLGRRPSAAALHATHRSTAGTHRSTRVDFLREMGALDLVDRIALLDVPTTVVWGSADRLTLPRLNREIARAIPGARAVELPGAGHQLPFEAPDRLAEVLVDASRSLSRSAP